MQTNIYRVDLFFHFKNQIVRCKRLNTASFSLCHNCLEVELLSLSIVCYSNLIFWLAEILLFNLKLIKCHLGSILIDYQILYWFLPPPQELLQQLRQNLLIPRDKQRAGLQMKGHNYLEYTFLQLVDQILLGERRNCAFLRDEGTESNFLTVWTLPAK